LDFDAVAFALAAVLGWLGVDGCEVDEGLVEC
jgi:hypothetical protein